MSSSYARACTEILEIIKYLPEDEYQRIPKEKIDFWNKNKDSSYNYKFDITKPINEQKISQETNALIILIFRDYFATESQKEKLKQILIENDRKIEEERKEKYKYEDIFKDNKKEKIELDKKEEEKSLVEIKNKNWLQKLFEKIKNAFKK